MARASMADIVVVNPCVVTSLFSPSRRETLGQGPTELEEEPGCYALSLGKDPEPNKIAVILGRPLGSHGRFS